MSTFQIDFGQQQSPIVGIDLGTTNSLVAVMGPQASPKSSPDRMVRKIVPSVVSVSPSGEILVGAAASEAL